MRMKSILQFGKLDTRNISLVIYSKDPKSSIEDADSGEKYQMLQYLCGEESTCQSFI
jgi:hypothetical protein